MHLKGNNRRISLSQKQILLRQATLAPAFRTQGSVGKSLSVRRPKKQILLSTRNLPQMICSRKPAQARSSFIEATPPTRKPFQQEISRCQPSRHASLSKKQTLLRQDTPTLARQEQARPSSEETIAPIY